MDGSSQFGGVDAATAHFHEMDVPIFEGVLDQFLFIVNLTNGDNGVASQM